MPAPSILKISRLAPAVFLLATCSREPKGPSVRYVIDGDTVVLDSGVHVRLIGIDTPEKDRPYYSEAKEFNRKLVEGKPARLDYDIEKTDRYGRTLAYLYLEDGTFVNAEMIRSGYANLYTFPPNLKHTEEFLALQREARQAGRGLWSLKTSLSSFYLSSARGHTFHRPECKFAKKIGKRNRVHLAGRDKALDRGLAPCRNCRP